jgi:Tfp pilus assembly protein PilV
MPSRRITRARSVPAALRGLGCGEQGSFLVEALISSLILVIVGLGVLQSVDRSARLGGEQRTQAVAGNVGQSEQALIRALPLAEQSNMRTTTTRAVGGVTYRIDSRSDWINDTSGGASCTTAGSSADYMKVSTTVTWPQMGARRPVTLESLITPDVRAFDAAQGSLSVQVSRADGSALGGLPVGLSGGATLSDATSSDGCVLWGYLPAASGYAVGFSLPGYVQPDGSAAVNAPVAVVGGQTSNLAFQYDVAGALQTSFTTRRLPSTAALPTNPQQAHVTNAGGVSIAFPVTGTRLTSGPLFPSTSAYTVHADTCATSEVPSPPPAPFPSGPGPAPTAVSALVTPGTTITSASMRLPALDVRVTSAGTPVAGATVRVTTACGTVYRRTTMADGKLADPGFPFGSGLALCVSDGTRSRQLSRDNTNFNAGAFAIDIASSDPLGTCP